MIIVKDVTKRYARAVAVDHISFSVEKGQIVGFLGPNGAGKTTTMRILTCFLSPSAGTASVAGFDVLEQPFEVALLRGRQLVVEHDDVDVERFADLVQLLRLALAHVRRGIGRRPALERDVHRLRARGLGEERQLEERVLGLGGGDRADDRAAALRWQQTGTATIATYKSVVRRPSERSLIARRQLAQTIARVNEKR